MQRNERRILLVQWGEVGRLSDDRLEVPIRLGVMDGNTAGLAVQDQLDAAEIPLDLADAGDRTGRIQNARAHLIDVFFLRDREDLAVRLLEGGFYGTQCRGTARTDGRRDAGEQHARAHLIDVFFLRDREDLAVR